MIGNGKSLISCLVILCLTGVSFEQTTSAADINSLPWCDAGTNQTTGMMTTGAVTSNAQTTQNPTSTPKSDAATTKAPTTSRAPAVTTTARPVTTTRSVTTTRPATTNNNGGQTTSSGGSGSGSGSGTTSSSSGGSGSGSGSGSGTTSSSSGGSGSGGSGSSSRFNGFIRFRGLYRFTRFAAVIGRVLTVGNIELAAFENQVKRIVGGDTSATTVTVESIGTDRYATVITVNLDTNSSRSFSIQDRVDTIVKDLKSNEAILRATLPPTISLTLDSSALEVTANETLTIDGVTKRTSCTKSANSNSISCETGTLRSDNSIAVESTRQIPVSFSFKTPANMMSVFVFVLSVVYFNMGF